MSTPPPGGPRPFDDLSREVALACDAGGALAWMDDRARALLGEKVGQPLRALAALGTEGQVDRLLALAREQLPQRIFLDFVPPDITAFDVLDALKGDARTRDIPVILHTSHELADDERARLANETAAILSRHTLGREVAISRIRDALAKARLGANPPQEARRG